MTKVSNEIAHFLTFQKKKKIMKATSCLKNFFFLSRRVFEGVVNKPEFISSMKCLQVSGNTVTRTKIISNNMRDHLMSDLQNCIWFSLQLESIHVSNTT